MKSRSRNLTLAVAVAVAALSGTALAATYTVYSNNFSTRSKVGELRLVKMSGQNNRCDKGHTSSRMMRVAIGKATTECNYTPPIKASPDGAFADWTVGVSSIISKNVAKSLRTKLFTSVALRLTSGNSRYRLDVYSSIQEFRLRHYVLGEFASEVTNARTLAGGERKVIKRPGDKNRLRLKIIQSNDNNARLVARINGTTVASVPVTGEPILKGPRAAITLGRDAGSSNGAVGFFDNLSIQDTN